MRPLSALQVLPGQSKAEAEGLAGSPAEWELKADGYSTAVWRVSGPCGQWALKVGQGAGAAVVAREASVLQHSHAAVPAMSYGGRAKWERTERAAWLITPWLDGPSTWTSFGDVRDGKLDRGPALAAAADLCVAVGALHQAGWVHGDVQPHHTLHMPSGVRLIDCSWAWSRQLSPSYAYEGGLLHLMSPELMARAESSQRPVVTAQPDEVYALAAGLWWAATNRWPRDYAQVGIDPARFTAIEMRRLLLRRRVPLGRIPHWPELEEVLRQTLTTDPSQRASALQLGQWLRSLGPH
ncbi:hypothetical protein ABZX93_33445 [Streptomyces sp. NPDC006632]|uniref:hypothetical protein n=1 Tax=Streptomyces sp. NPDC006632 TaxID=3157182 RepID=UPI0033A5ADC6